MILAKIFPISSLTFNSAVYSNVQGEKKIKYKFGKQTQIQQILYSVFIEL